MPLSLDSSLAIRPDVGTQPGARATTGVGAASPGERQQFEQTLARAAALGKSTAAGAAQAAGTARVRTEPTLVTSTRTRLSGTQAANALRSAWTEVRGTPPSTETLSILVGQWAHETGRGASMLNFNFGGLKGTGPSGLSAVSMTREGWGTSEVHIRDRFRAYASADEGARDYVSLLARRYPDAVSAAEQGDAQGFVSALKAGGYFTDNAASYARSVQSLANQARIAGFDAIGAEPRGATTVAAPARGTPELAAAAFASRELASAELGSPALASAAHDLTGLSVPESAFADEVNRAALLMSALRIAEPDRRRG